MSIKKLTTLIAVPALSLSLVACSSTSDEDAGTKTDQAPAESVVTEEAATEEATTTAVTDDDKTDDDGDDQADDTTDDNDDQAPAAGAAQGELPDAVTGYTSEAEAEMAEDGVSEADVERVLAEAKKDGAGVETEWDDDGYWEIELGEIDIDIDPDGLVREVGRDD